MTTLPGVVLGALLFALAGWIGTLLADAFVARRSAEPDGPAPVHVPRVAYLAVGASAGALLATRALPLPTLLLALAVVMTLCGAAAADFAVGLLPDAFTLGPLTLVIAVAAFQHVYGPAFGATFVALPFAGGALVSRGRGMGWGDVKLAALGGALLGARDATLAFTAAAIVAYVVTRRAGHAGRPIAFGPYLAFAIVAMLALSPGT